MQEPNSDEGGGAQSLVEPPRITSQSQPLVMGRGRGRPALMTPTAVIERIRQLARGEGGLYRVHRAHSDLYARARRQFGSWAGAVRAAGLDYSAALTVARRRSLETRRKLRRQRVHPAQ
jgi:hypothetical protein